MDKSFSSWIEAFASPHQARCKRCCKTIELSNMGRQAVKSHETSAQHKRNSTNCPTQTSIAQFMQPKYVGEKAGPVKTATVSTSDAVNESLSVIIKQRRCARIATTYFSYCRQTPSVYGSISVQRFCNKGRGLVVTTDRRKTSFIEIL